MRAELGMWRHAKICWCRRRGWDDKRFVWEYVHSCQEAGYSPKNLRQSLKIRSSESFNVWSSTNRQAHLLGPRSLLQIQPCLHTSKNPLNSHHWTFLNEFLYLFRDSNG